MASKAKVKARPGPQLGERMRQIEDAALALFLKRGFHGVGLREIAQQAGVSLGNIYNHFEGKEPIFASLMARLYGAFAADALLLVEIVNDGPFPEGLEALGRAVGALVERHRSYLTLVYVDIAEFDGAHARAQYQGLAQNFEALMGARFEALRKEKAMPKGVDPAVAFTLIYMQFANYFIVERLIGADHLGISQDAALSTIAKLYGEGLRRRP